tara:strand:+ start:1548 stop:1817 length:270 start_codon:yes stop_codon:yes gene_type:complete
MESGLTLTVKLELLGSDDDVKVEEFQTGKIHQISGAYYRVNCETNMAPESDETYKNAMNHVNETIRSALQITGGGYPLRLEIEYPLKQE